MKKTVTPDTEISNINRQCYDALGNSYTDGAEDLETLIQTGIWQEFVNRGGANS